MGKLMKGRLCEFYQARASPKGERAAWYSYPSAWYPPYFLRNGWTNQVRPIYGKWSVRGRERQVYQGFLKNSNIQNFC